MSKMDSPKIVYKYYSNPAFCGQSEVVFSQKTPCVSSKISIPDRPRMPPLGANSPRKAPAHDRSNHRLKTDISDNPLRITKYTKDEPPELPPKPPKFAHSRTSSNTSFQRQSSVKYSSSFRSSSRSRSRSEELEMSALSLRQRSYTESDDGMDDRSKHRYEVIADDLDDIADYSPTKKRIVEADADEVEEYNVDGPDDNEMKAIPTEIVKTVNGKIHRYAIVPTEEEEPRKQIITFSPKMSQKNLIATQKLHELLSTPRKSLKSYGSQPSVRMVSRTSDSPKVHQTTPSKKMTSSTPTHGITPSRSCANLASARSPKEVSPISPKALQKLNYGMTEDLNRSDLFVRSFREKSQERSFDLNRGRLNRSLDLDRRETRREYERRIRGSQRRDKTTAVITPRLALPSPSEYSDDTYKSWTTLKYLSAATATLAVAALMMTLCGGLSAGLSFYIMYTMGRRYYLDFGVLSGFTCLLLGLLGFRSRKYQLLPNRNYISGYIVLSVFSLLSAACLLILLCAQPRPGSALNDVSGGAVCALSALSLALASLGVFTSYCCRHPPPDNRVANGRTKWY